MPIRRRNIWSTSDNVQLSVERIPAIRFPLIAPRDYSKKLSLASQPIRKKIKTNRDLVVRVFPRLEQLPPFSFHWLFGILSAALIG